MHLDYPRQNVDWIVIEATSGYDLGGFSSEKKNRYEKVDVKASEYARTARTVLGRQSARNERQFTGYS